MINEKDTSQLVVTECEVIVSMNSEYIMTSKEFTDFFNLLPIVSIEDAQPERIKRCNV